MFLTSTNKPNLVKKSLLITEIWTSQIYIPLSWPWPLTFDLDIKFTKYHFFVLSINQIWWKYLHWLLRYDPKRGEKKHSSPVTLNFDLWPWYWICIIMCLILTYKPNLVKKTLLVTKIWPRQILIPVWWPWPLTFDLDIKFAQYHFFVLPANQIWWKNLHWLQRYGPRRVKKEKKPEKKNPSVKQYVAK